VCGRGLKLAGDFADDGVILSPAVCGRGLKQATNEYYDSMKESPAVCGRGLKPKAAGTGRR